MSSCIYFFKKLTKYSIHTCITKQCLFMGRELLKMLLINAVHLFSQVLEFPRLLICMYVPTHKLKCKAWRHSPVCMHRCSTNIESRVGVNCDLRLQNVGNSWYANRIKIWIIVVHHWISCFLCKQVTPFITIAFINFRLFIPIRFVSGNTLLRSKIFS